MIDQGTPEEWLERLFEFEYCSECGRDADEHEVVGILGNYFARCKQTADQRPDESSIEEMDDPILCHECGEPMNLDENGVSNHLTESGRIDYDADSDHVALDSREFD